MRMYRYQSIDNVNVLILPFHGYLRWEERYVQSYMMAFMELMEGKLNEINGL